MSRGGCERLGCPEPGYSPHWYHCGDTAEWRAGQACEERQARKREHRPYVAEGYWEALRKLWAELDDTDCSTCGEPMEVTDRMLGDLLGRCPQGHMEWRVPETENREAA